MGFPEEWKKQAKEIMAKSKLEVEQEAEKKESKVETAIEGEKVEKKETATAASEQVDPDDAKELDKIMEQMKA